MASELISPSQLRASTTDQTASGNWIGGHHSIDNVKEVSPNDQFDHLTLWQSEFDPNCAKQQIFADWSSLGPQTVSNFTILYTTKSAGVPTRVTLKPPGSLRDVTNQIACKNYTVTKNDNKRVQQVDCVLRAPIASTVASGIIFTFQPRPLSLTPTLSYCQIGIYEVRFVQ
ncbi:hypothetical protein BC830DRAFT_1130990 [Chytriomyces sp. MP71]|nr:hypothetical protein BC830DRAFT_1130990 [Chytriomyces sp. MP71]